MKLFNIIAIFIYTLLFCILGAALIALSLQATSLEAIVNTISHMPYTNNMRFGIALTGLLLILVNISIAQLSIGRLQRHKTIAFENPYGRVTLSLSAIEDYIKKLTYKMPEIKEIRSSITAGKSGIEVNARAAFYSDVNIPEVTEKVQNAIRVRLQEILGIEENVVIKIHVTKIVQTERDDGPKHIKEQPVESGFKGEIEYGRKGEVV